MEIDHVLDASCWVELRISDFSSTQLNSDFNKSQWDALANVAILLELFPELSGASCMGSVKYFILIVRAGEADCNICCVLLWYRFSAGIVGNEIAYAIISTCQIDSCLFLPLKLFLPLSPSLISTSQIDNSFLHSATVVMQHSCRNAVLWLLLRAQALP